MIRKLFASAPSLLVVICLLSSCEADMGDVEARSEVGMRLDAIAEQYVKVSLGFRAYDDSYVDAYYGPPEWSDAAESRGVSLEELKNEAEGQLARIRATDVRGATAILAARKDGLEKRLGALLLRMEMAVGARLAFDEESRILFDATAPIIEEANLRDQIGKIDALLPGQGALSDRVTQFRRAFEISADKLPEVFDAAIEECRRRTLAHIPLPVGESFSIEYVTDQPWSGYNWYQGSGHSLIQINTDLPIYIDRAIALGCHEGYPGHHTYNVLVEEALVKGRGWIEFSLVPLYGPMSLISEGSANYGIELAFPDAERRLFEKNTLFPLAGFRVEEADRYHDLRDALEPLKYAEVAIARDYLNGAKNRAEAVAWLRDYALLSEERASQRVRFFDAYRSYVINYSVGEDLIAAYLTRRAGANFDLRWQEFARLLSNPVSPSDIK